MNRIVIALLAAALVGCVTPPRKQVHLYEKAILTTQNHTVAVIGAAVFVAGGAAIGVWAANR